MSFSEKMAQLEELEAEIKNMVQSLKRDIVMMVEAQPFRGQIINDGKNGGPIMGTIPFSQMMKSSNWSPEYHFPQKQAEAVLHSLDKCVSVTDVCSAIRRMMEQRFVNVNGTKVYLNEETIQILEASDIGKYCKREEN